MKNILLLSLLFTAIAASSQTRPAYCDLQATNFWGGRNVYIILDFGSLAYGTINNHDGTARKFCGIVDALNYMAQLGWSIRDTYYISEGKDKVLHYLLEKTVQEDSQILDGLLIQSQERKDKREKEPYKPGANGDDIY